MVIMWAKTSGVTPESCETACRRCPISMTVCGGSGPPATTGTQGAGAAPLEAAKAAAGARALGASRDAGAAGAAEL